MPVAQHGTFVIPAGSAASTPPPRSQSGRGPLQILRFEMRSFEWIQTAPGSMTSAALGRWGFTLALQAVIDASQAHYARSPHQLRFLLRSELSFPEPWGRGAACDARSPAKTSTQPYGRSRSPAMTPRAAPCDRQTYTHGSAAVRGSCTGRVGRAARDK
ncbi:hypothetical protein HETIRDRAFT_449125 [Heterobasidion irregulare TC 32-1]|uniref:Uncharacterized protein n=1 Tax=Heterobasidion irregulare (strain TC 32-1) TaxID=747525 RepID=W4KK85_HETIT|nr:uncharacterized protein HETIRDRAFT_449125 [Heterobasidion irregulare TC 32-1]ETW86257.1 hypothetical protein HETIRDRAFT_449125 [Heterobasidion irregulare TC 32-1]